MPYFRNKLLQHLDADIIARLDLRPVNLEQGRQIENPGESIEHLFFLEVGIGSMTNTFEDGSQVEVGMFGHESVMCASALIGTRKSLNRVYMQIGGHGNSCHISAAKREFLRFERFHDLSRVRTCALRNFMYPVASSGIGSAPLIHCKPRSVQRYHSERGRFIKSPVGFG